MENFSALFPLFYCSIHLTCTRIRASRAPQRDRRSRRAPPKSGPCAPRGLRLPRKTAGRQNGWHHPEDRPARSSGSGSQTTSINHTNHEGMNKKDKGIRVPSRTITYMLPHSHSHQNRSIYVKYRNSSNNYVNCSQYSKSTKPSTLSSSHRWVLGPCRHVRPPNHRCRHAVAAKSAHAAARPDASPLVDWGREGGGLNGLGKGTEGSAADGTHAKAKGGLMYRG